MKPTTWTAWKVRLLDLAEVWDAWRIVPRTVLTVYGCLCWELAKWFMALKDPTGAQTSFVTAVVGLAVPLTGFYMQTGRKWQ